MKMSRKKTGKFGKLRLTVLRTEFVTITDMSFLVSRGQRNPLYLTPYRGENSDIIAKLLASLLRLSENQP